MKGKEEKRKWTGGIIIKKNKKLQKRMKGECDQTRKKETTNDIIKEDGREWFMIEYK